MHFSSRLFDNPCSFRRNFRFSHRTDPSRHSGIYGHNCTCNTVPITQPIMYTPHSIVQTIPKTRNLAQNDTKKNETSCYGDGEGRRGRVELIFQNAQLASQSGEHRKGTGALPRQQFEWILSANEGRLEEGLESAR